MIKVILMILLLSAVEDPVLMTVEFPDMASCMAARKDVANVLGSHFITPTSPPVQMLVRCYEGEVKASNQ